MLDQQIFLRGMQQLGGYYKGFGLNAEESQIWYQPFKEMTPEEFKDTLQNFMKASTYPPNNPTMIINPAGVRVIPMSKSIKEAIERDKQERQRLALQEPEPEITREELIKLLQSFK